MLHVVRNPWSAYADTKKRPVPLSLAHYMLGWTLNQYHALLFRERFPGRLHIVRAEDVMADSVGDARRRSARRSGSRARRRSRTPSWNGTPLDEVYPWGTIRTPTPDAEPARRPRSSRRPSATRSAQRAWQYLEVFDYQSFV